MAIEMQKMEFTIKSESGKTQYDVTAQIDGENASLVCSCIAARSNRACKHRLMLLKGDATDVVKSSHTVSQLCDAIRPTSIGKAMQQLTTAEELLERAQDLHKAKKQQITDVMSS